jgi:putative DNA primase/helicase
MLNSLDALNEFNEAVARAGLRTKKRIIGTGKIERFPVEGDAGTENSGWAVLFLDSVPSGSFGNWRTGEKHTWCSRDRATLTKNEQVQVAQLLAQAEVKRAREQERLQKLAAAKAMELLSESQSGPHPYLAAKRVNPFSSRVRAGELLIPIQDRSGAVTSLQRIAADGTKRFLYGGRIVGCFNLFGEPSGITYLTEGWATGATIHLLTGRPVVVAFNAGNLLPVARSIREAYPKARLVTAADNDAWGTFNTGIEKAKALAELGVPFIAPTFAPSDVKPTDFNDLMVIEGNEVALAQLMALPDIPEPESLPAPLTETPEQWVVLPDVKGEKSTPISTIRNLEEVLRRLGITVRYNVISKQEEILIPGAEFSMDNRANAAFAYIESRCANYNMPTEKVGQFLTYLADKNQYSPVVTWIDSKPWDGVDRLHQFYDTVQVIDEEYDSFKRSYKEMILLRWMTSAVAAAYRPNGLPSQGVLVFQGMQAMGKTSWFKRLAPSDVLMDGVTLDLRDKDSHINALGYWLVELGELDATFRKTDIAQMKSFLTRDRDVVRMPYARKKSEFPRRTVFFASVNSDQFLHDDTGNRRFWVLECEKINYTHRIDMQQVWAQVLAGYRAGERWFLSKKELEMLNECNSSFEVSDPIEDELKSKLDWSSDTVSWSERTAKEILVGVGITNPTKSDCMRAAAAIKKITGRNSRRTGQGRLILAPLS